MWNMIGLWLLQYKLIAGWLVDIFVIHSTDVVIGWQWDVDPVGMGDISYGDDQQYLVGDLEHDFYDFPSIGNVIIPTDELIFFRGVGQPPTRYLYIS